MAGLGPCFWGTVAAILAVIGLSLYPLIGQEAFYPALMFLDTNAIAQLLAVSVVSGTILLSIAGTLEKVRGRTGERKREIVRRLPDGQGKTHVDPDTTHSHQRVPGDPRPVS